MQNDWPNDFVAWDALNSELPEFRKEISASWSAKLDDKTLTERDLLPFLQQHTGFFFCDSRHSLVTIAELELGADRKPDFVRTFDRASYGFIYELIEVESPHVDAYDSRGRPSSALRNAVHQIEQWRMWIESHKDEAKRLFPSKQFHMTGRGEFRYTIIIGRRRDNDASLHTRNHYAHTLGIEIRTFDYLSDHLQERYFHGVPLTSSAQFDALPIKVKNELANPFTAAYPSRVWRTLTKHPSFSDNHMVAANATLLIQSRQLCDKQHGFLEHWSQLNPAIRNRLIARTKSIENLRVTPKAHRVRPTTCQ
jgi:hypothetical protein